MSAAQQTHSGVHTRAQRHTTPVIGAQSSKGGTGKSSVSANLAAAAASGGARVLLIDVDQQISATSVMLTHHHTGATVLDSINNPTDTPQHVIPSDWSHLPEIRNSGGTLDIIPGHEHLTDTQLQPTPENPRRLFALRECVAAVSDNYDLVVFDCPPSKGSIVQSVLLASSVIIAVTTPEYLDIRGLAETLRFVDAFHREAQAIGEPSAQVGYVIVNKLDIQQRDHRDGLAEISSQVVNIPWRQTPRRAVVPRVTAQGLPLIGAGDRAAAPVAEAVRELTADILQVCDSPVLAEVGERLRQASTGRKRTSLRTQETA